MLLQEVSWAFVGREYIEYTVPLKSLMTFLKEINNFIQQGITTLIKSDSKTCIMLQNILLQINALLLNFLFIKNPGKKLSAKLFSTLIIIRNIYWATNKHIRMISEGLCDTEDCDNNSALTSTGIHYILKYIKIETCNNISQYYCFFCKINAALLSIRDIFKK